MNLGRGGRLHTVVAGHVDHGKSTIVGRLLADTHSLPEGRLAQVREACERMARPFEYAFLLDALKDERAQGITIDAARVFFSSAKRQYLILDAPGHPEFLRNMVTGASRADAALLVVDAKEGARDDSRRHGYLISLLGIRKIAVLVNKMDLVGYARETFEAIAEEYGAFLQTLGVPPACCIPVSGREGDNIAVRSRAMAWYGGPTVLEGLDGFEPEVPPAAGPFRMPVQDVYRFTGRGDTRRIVAGTIESGTLRVGDDLVFYPSGKRSRVRTIEGTAPSASTEASAGAAAGFTLVPEIYVTRGELATRAAEPAPSVTTRLRASLFWLGRQPLVRKKDYVLKLGMARVAARVEEITRVIDPATLAVFEHPGRVERHEVAECVLRVKKAIAFDVSSDVAATGRFVLVEDFDIRGGGIVREALTDVQAPVRDRVLLRNSKWEASMVSLERRAERYSQRPSLLLVTGAPGADRKAVAKALETRLFADGRLVYFLGIGNVLYGVDSDLERTRENRREHIRRLSEVANLMLDAGMILIVTAQELTQADLEVVETATDPDRIETVWLGSQVTTDVEYDVQVPDQVTAAQAVEEIMELLRDKGIIFQPW